MDYKKLVIDLIEKLNLDQLKILYQFIRAMVD